MKENVTRKLNQNLLNFVLFRLYYNICSKIKGVNFFLTVKTKFGIKFVLTICVFISFYINHQTIVKLKEQKTKHFL